MSKEKSEGSNFLPEMPVTTAMEAAKPIKGPTRTPIDERLKAKFASIKLLGFFAFAAVISTIGATFLIVAGNLDLDGAQIESILGMAFDALKWGGSAFFAGTALQRVVSITKED